MAEQSVGDHPGSVDASGAVKENATSALEKLPNARESDAHLSVALVGRRNTRLEWNPKPVNPDVRRRGAKPLCPLTFGQQSDECRASLRAKICERRELWPVSKRERTSFEGYPGRV
jgi:hypothetical protein